MRSEPIVGSDACSTFQLVFTRVDERASAMLYGPSAPLSVRERDAVLVTVALVTVCGRPATLTFAGIALASATMHSFFVLACDVKLHRSVGFADLWTVAQNCGQTGRSYSQGNIDYSPDGLVSFSDLLILAQRYGTSLIRTDPKPSVFGGRSIGRRGLFEAEDAVIV